MTFLHSEDSYSWKLRPISYSRCGFIHFMLTFTLTGEAASHCSCSLAATGDLDRLCKVPTATPASAAAQLQALYPPVQTDLDRRERERERERERAELTLFSATFIRRRS
jgi:hypothetical protein